MNWKTIKLITLGLLSALFILFAGATFAQDTTNKVQLVKIGSDITIVKDQVVEEAVAIGGDVIVRSGGRVTEQAVAVGGDVTLENNTRIDGQVVAIGGEIIQQEGAVVTGQTITVFSGMKVIVDRFGLLGTLYLTNVALCLLSLLIITVFGIFLVLLLPGHLQTIASTISQHPFKSGIWGVGGLIIAALITTLLAGSILGVLLIPIVNLAVVITGLIGCTVTGIWSGQKTTSRPGSALIRDFLVGILILALISLLPVVGGLIVLMVNLFGFGAALLSRFGVLQPEKIQKTFDQLEGTSH